MKVICPRCHTENQCNSTQVYCGYCNHLIDIRSQREEPSAGGNRSGMPRPYAGNRGGYGDEHSNAPRSGGDSRGRRERDDYATRIGDDFDDLLEINNTGGVRGRGQTASLDVDQLFDSPSSGGVGGGNDHPPMGRETIEVGRPEYPPYSGQSWQSEDYGGYNYGAGQVSDQQAGHQRRETREFNEDLHASIMGWPMLTDNENLDDDDHDDSAGRQGIGMRILLGTAVFAGLIGGAYFFLGDLISKRQDQADGLILSDRSAGSPAPGPQASTPQATSPQAGSTSASAAPVTTPPPGPTPEIPTSPLPGGQTNSSKPPAAVGGQSQPVDIPPVIGRNSSPAPPVPLPVVPETAAAPSAPVSGDWTIQVASYNNQRQADERLASLKGAGMPARVVRIDLPGKGTWYRLQIGGFGSREEGTRYGNQLRSRGSIQDFIVTQR